MLEEGGEDVESAPSAGALPPAPESRAPVLDNAAGETSEDIAASEPPAATTKEQRGRSRQKRR